LKALGFTFLVPMEQQSKLLTAVIEPTDPHYDFIAMHDYLFERGFTIYPGKGAKENTFRVANIGAIDKVDIGRFLDALGGYLKEAGVAVM
jgi:2-aminoethylphosphonate-pyruvate transaminase